MKNLLVVASDFPPKQAAGVFRTLRFVRYLPDFGWNTDVLTLRPDSYDANTNIDEQLLEEVPIGARIHRTRALHPLIWVNRLRRLCSTGRSFTGNKDNRASSANSNRPGMRHPRSIKQKLKDVVTVPFMTPDRLIGWLPFAVRTGKRILKNHSIDALYSSGPPWTNHLIGLKLKQSSGRPWIADFRDPWLGNDYRASRRENTWSGRKHQQWESRVVRMADRIVINTNRSQQEMMARYPQEDEAKFVVIPNGFDPADFEGISIAEPTSKPSTPLTIFHAGSFYGKRNINAFIRALGDLCTEGAVERDKIRVDLIGALRSNRTNELKRIAAAGLNDVINVLPSVPHQDCLAQLARASILLLVQTDAPLCVPGKVFEYIALGRPILTLAGPGATRDLMLSAQLGPCIDPDCEVTIRTTLSQIYHDHFHGIALSRPISEVQSAYDGRRLTGQLAAVIDGIPNT